MKQFLLTVFLLASAFSQAQVVNDDCANATVIPVNSGVICNATATGTFAGATASAGATTTCTGIPDDDIWFKFTATHTRHIITLTPTPATNQSINGVLYTGDCGSLTQKQCFTYISNFYSNKLWTADNLIIGQIYTLRVYSAAATPVTTTINICVNVPHAIDITTNYTAQQLVEDVLFNTPCLTISNITSSGAANYGLATSIGYFEKGASNFPFDKGILLSTGSAQIARGPNTFPDQSNTGGWPGDSDLQTIFAGTGGTGSNTYNDATSLQFDFVPAIDHISFDFLFASEEYGAYQCTFGDAFAFILTHLATGTKTNLAVLPGTNTPVAVTTINNSSYIPAGAATCVSQNQEYFGSYYTNGDITSSINFNGHTVPLTAESAVIPGQQYRIKLVIANKGDHQMNSAVFIDAGSFNIGGLNDEYVQLTSSAGNILCNGASTALSLNANPAFTYLWSTGATTNTLTVSQPGTYSVAVSVPGSADCMVEYSINIIDGDSVAEGIEINDYWIYEQNSDGVATFILSTKTDEIINIIGSENITVSYYLTLADAQLGLENQLPLLYTNPANPQTLYARIENPVNDCYTVASFQIGTIDQNYICPMPTGSTTQTFTEGQTLADIEIQGQNIQWYATPGGTTLGTVQVQNAEQPLPLSTLLVNGTTYYASQTLFGIESIDRLPVTVNVTLGTEDRHFSSLHYYPNPVKDILTITNTHIDTVIIVNMMGQTVLQQNVNGSNAQLNTNGLQQGVYFVKIASGTAEKTIKIIRE